MREAPARQEESLHQMLSELPAWSGFPINWAISPCSVGQIPRVEITGLSTHQPVIAYLEIVGNKSTQTAACFPAWQPRLVLVFPQIHGRLW